MKKYLVSLVLVVALVAGLISTSTLADTGGAGIRMNTEQTSRFEIFMNAVTAKAGEDVSVTIRLNEDISVDEDITNIQGELYYNTEILSYQSHKMADAYADYMSKNLTGKERFQFSDTSLTNTAFTLSQGDMITIVFAANSDITETVMSDCFRLEMKLSTSEAVTTEVTTKITVEEKDDGNGDVTEDDKEDLKEEIIRISGANRYMTCFRIADTLKEELCVEQFENVIIAYGDNFPDALAGSYLAAKKKAPILMVDGKNATTIANLQTYIKENLKTGGKIYILGGTGVIPDSVKNGLEAYDITRLSGKNRYDTNLAILKEAGVTNEEILVCTGTNFADSLSGSATALPLLLVDPKGTDLTAAQKEFLSKVDSQITIIGGSAAVKEEYKTALTAYDADGKVDRLSGKGRYETSVAVAKKYFPEAEKAVIAYAYNFPDGLCGGPLAYSMEAPLILTGVEMKSGKPNGTVAKGAAAAAAYVSDQGIKSGMVLGGAGVLTDETVRIVFSMDPNEEIIK